MSDGFTCPICRGASVEEMRFEQASVFRCGVCEHRFSANVKLAPVQIYTPAYTNDVHKKWFDNPDRALFKQIGDEIAGRYGMTARVVDVGCGNGNFLRALHERGFANLVGVDLLENRAEGIEFVQADIFDFEPREPFDVAVSMMNVEHVGDVEAYLRRFMSFVRDGGMIVLNTIDDSSVIYRVARAMERVGFRFAAKRLYDPHHVNHFSSASLQRLVERVGLSILRVSHKNYPLNAIDVPGGIKGYVLLAGVAVLNQVTDVLGGAISQTVFLGVSRAGDSAS